MRAVIRAGTNQVQLLDTPLTTIDSARKVAGLDFEIEIIRLRQFGEMHFMMCDEIAYMRRVQPLVNGMASELYWANCIPGTTHHILGDVVVFPASDFPPEDDELE